MRWIGKVVVHCSDSPDDRNIGLKEIDQWHRDRGFKMVGYHYIIRRDGTVEIGRPVSMIGAHAAKQNLDSIGICWVGRDDCNSAQRETLIKLVKQLMAQFKLLPHNIYGHCEFDAHKTCPRIDMVEFRKELT